ncbi:MAG: hypothetical protein EXX96DRAFT_488390, partial [Benjaminiella poitrasii]
IGFVKVKRLCQSKSMYKFNLDLYRLGIFCKNFIKRNGLKLAMAVQAVGANIMIFIIKNLNDACKMTEIRKQ